MIFTDLNQKPGIMVSNINSVHYSEAKLLFVIVFSNGKEENYKTEMPRCLTGSVSLRC